jgi:diguanylate cyclase (GGDEF)-like protein
MGMQTKLQGLDKRNIILAHIAAFIVIGVAISALVTWSVRSVTENANNLDNARSQSTVIAALNNQMEQTAGLVRDNGIWDDAAVAAYETNDTQWMYENWGATTLDYPLYNEAVVIEADGTPVMAYDNGVPLAWTLDQFYGPSFRALLSQVRANEGLKNDAPVASAFVMTPEGLTIISMGPILPSALDMKVEHASKRYLILSRQISAADVAALGEAYVIPALNYLTTPTEGLQAAPIKDALGAVLGYITWPAQLPGNTSFSKVVPYLIGALSLFISFLIGLGGFTNFLMKSLRKDKLQAQHDSTHDPLSGLLNRAGLFRKMQKMLDQGHTKSVTTLIYLDLDGFKDVNDSYGHIVGDALICVVAKKLIEITPASAHVSRLGGDEFAILLAATQNDNSADQISNALHALFREPFEISGRTVVVGASVGIVTANDSNTTPEEMVRQADMAMYRAKDLGRGKTIVYQPSFDADRVEQNALETDLRETIAANGLDIAFQPLVDAKTSKWHGVEALARWHNKRLDRSIGPDVFITIAERSGLIEMLGLQILRKALEGAKNWPDLKISVNVSPAQFRNPAFPDQVVRILEETNFDPKRLTLEITEGFFIRNPERAQRIVGKLKALGISLSLDDFGSGFSSIGYLRQFAFDRLKIDRSFVSALDKEANAPSVIHATVALANAFNIPVTAEGVEREEQASILRLTGCDEFQGYLFGRPMSALDIDRIVVDKHGQAA